jgi:twitching motility two-component system response regulator PilH
MAKILIVDDSSFQRRMIRGLLTRLGHEVIEADSGAAGIALLAAERPDLMMLDLLMPEMTGYEVLERLRQTRDPAPLLILTADVQDTARQRCMSLGAARVLNKPPRLAELQQAIESALAASEAPR